MQLSSSGDCQIMKAESLQICKDFLGPPWDQIGIAEFDFSVMAGGLCNSMYRCGLPDSVKDSDPKVVLLRIYGPLQEDTHKVVIEITIFMLLAEKNLGPKLFGVFPKGRLEEFIPSRSLKKKDYRELFPMIARELAKIHALDLPLRKVPDFLQTYMEKWVEDAEKESASRLKTVFDLGDSYREEIVWIMNELSKSSSPIMFCHNDLQGGNILLSQDSLTSKIPKITLIDFEFGAYNYRNFDLANQFCEWCFDYNTEDFPHYHYEMNKFPSQGEQTAYISVYLDQLVKEGVIPASSVAGDLQGILREIPLFCMAVHLLWSMWSIKMSFSTESVFAYRDHATARRNLYFTLKEQYFPSMKDTQMNVKEHITV